MPQNDGDDARGCLLQIIALVVFLLALALLTGGVTLAGNRFESKGCTSIEFIQEPGRPVR